MKNSILSAKLLAYQIWSGVALVTVKSSKDLILTNKTSSFQLTKATETGVNDEHLLISTYMKNWTFISNRLNNKQIRNAL